MQARRTDTGARQRGKPKRPAGPAGRRGTGAGRSPAPAPERHGLFRRRGPWLALAVVVAAVLVVTAVVAGRDGDGDLAQRTAELEEQEAARQAVQVTELTEVATTVHGQLLVLMAELHEALPVDGSAAATADASALAAWRAVVDGARAEFGDPPSASTEVNSTRAGLVLAVDLLSSALLAYESALDAGGADRQRLEGLATDLRRSAVDAWAVAATQLDLLNIDLDDRHVHLYLPVRPGEAVVDPHGHD